MPDAWASQEVLKTDDPFSNPRVLVLHAYHNGFTWSDNISAGIQRVFKKQAPHVELLFEFMDVKRVYSEAHLIKLFDHLTDKYRDQKVDAIIAADDHAVDFLIDQGRQFLSGVPMVFCGLNGYDPRRHQSNGRPMTGVVESIDIKATLDVALKLQPSTRRVAYVADGSVTGQALRRQAETVFESYRDRLQFTYLEHRSMPQLQQAVALLPANAIVFAFIFSRDEHGRIWSHEYNLERLAEKCPVPIFSVWEFYLGHGMAGGMLTSGRAHGEKAAELTLRILAGETAAAIPVVKQSPNRLMFDFAEMKRFGLSSKKLPEDAAIVNQPFSVYKHYKYLIWGAADVFVILMVLVGFLTRDIWLRKQAEKALQHSEARYRNVYDIAPLAFVVWDRDCRILDWNEQAEQTFGWSQQEAVGQNFFELIVGEADQELVRDVVDNLLRGIVQSRIVNRNVTRSGRLIWCEWNNAVLYDDKGDISGALSLGLDITQRVEAEEALKRHQQTLEETVQERTSQLAETMKALETSNRDLEQFAYIASHDLQEPLRKVQAFSNLLRSRYADVLDEKGLDYLQRMESGGGRMQTMVNDLLEYSRVKTRGRPFAAIDLNEMVGAAIGDLEILLEKTGGSVQAEDLVTLEADPNQMQRLFVNLIGNGLKFHADGRKPVVRIYCDNPSEADSESASICRIVVEDNGIGIEAQYVDRIFKPFQRLHGKDKYPGTGIGLAICRKIVERHNGMITAESSMGAGTRFIVTLPRAQSSLESNNGKPEKAHHHSDGRR